MDIFTWSEKDNNGAIQMETLYGYPFSDLITKKPILTFDFKNLYYNDYDGRYLVDDVEMTDIQKAEVYGILRKLTPPLEWVKSIKSMPFNSYMQETAWYIERLMDPSSGKAVPEDVLTKRAICREQLSLIKECTTIEQLEQLGGVII